MIVSISISLVTDGDFSLREFPELDSAFITLQEQEEEDYFLTRKYVVDDYMMDPRDFLEKVLCEIHVSFTHSWLIETFYKLFQGAIKALSAKECFYGVVDGNYEGTCIDIDFTE